MTGRRSESKEWSSQSVFVQHYHSVSMHIVASFTGGGNISSKRGFW